MLTRLSIITSSFIRDLHAKLGDVAETSAADFHVSKEAAQRACSNKARFFDLIHKNEVYTASINLKLVEPENTKCHDFLFTPKTSFYDLCVS
jgi:hypothetical protein